MAAFFERSRSYGVGLTLATQNLNHPRLRPILDSVLINTRTHVMFGGTQPGAPLHQRDGADVEQATAG